LTEIYLIESDETAALNERLEQVASQIEQALPNILNLTNKIGATLDNATLLTSNLNTTATSVQPLLADLRVIMAQLNGPGTLGTWLIPTNLNQHLESSVATVDTNLPVLFAEITATLENLSAITSNLNAQVQANPHVVSNVSKTITDADDMVQGLKRHWLLRSAFKTNAPTKK
jgi:methyl-accepting chemotaxis protein